MSVLLIEIGNTALKAAWADGKILRKTMRYQGEKTMDFISTLLEKETPEVVVMASVRDVTEEDVNFISSRCGRLVLLDRNHTDLLKAYGIPEWITPDRAASIIAVRNLFPGKACVLFDFGTTVSVDFLDENGTYGGGNISPGFRTRFKALNRYSRSLPLVNAPKTSVPKGHSLISAIEAGVISGIKFEVDGYIASAPQAVAVFTGGDAAYFAQQTENSVFVVGNLVLMGLATISEDYES